MGILNFVEEAAGAFAAEKAVEAVDPNAGFLEKAAAAVAGFEGVEKVKGYLNEGEQAPAPTADATAQAIDDAQIDPNATA